MRVVHVFFSAAAEVGEKMFMILSARSFIKNRQQYVAKYCYIVEKTSAWVKENIESEGL